MLRHNTRLRELLGLRPTEQAMTCERLLPLCTDRSAPGDGKTITMTNHRDVCNLKQSL